MQRATITIPPPIQPLYHILSHLSYWKDELTKIDDNFSLVIISTYNLHPFNQPSIISVSNLIDVFNVEKREKDFVVHSFLPAMKKAIVNIQLTFFQRIKLALQTLRY